MRGVGLPDRSHASGDSFYSSTGGLNPSRIRDRSLLPQFLTRPEIRPPRAAASREVDYVTMPKQRGRKNYFGNIADSTGALSDREGDGTDSETNRVVDLLYSR